jgi:hypothetical protein
MRDKLAALAAQVPATNNKKNKKAPAAEPESDDDNTPSN